MAQTSERFLVRYWGVRGSIPTPGPETVIYGGNTTCIEIRCDDTCVIIDTGTGARQLGDILLKEAAGSELEIYLIYSHLHLDHIQGFPFFAPIYESQTTLHVYSQRPRDLTPREVLEWQMAFPWFPVDLERLPSDIEFNELTAGDTLKLGAVQLSTCPMNHPGGAMGIRIDHRGHAFVQASDIEHEGDALAEPLVELAKGADFLSYDSTYVAGDEYERYKGFGHSTWQHGVKTARAAGVDKFIAFHHDPSHDDAFMDQVAADIEAEWPGSLVAKECMTLDLLAGTVSMQPKDVPTVTRR